ncbi:MAG: hypothetical protein E7Z87_07315 [Cyanobacteria bacterium SIG26]|nr:hypothetical protein [Cyanobacteria bacterium SIG26]
MQQFGGVQLNSKPGVDMYTQYNLPDTAMTNLTTLPQRMLYNLAQVVFGNDLMQNIAHEPPKCDVIGSDGLKTNAIKPNDAKVFTQA